MGLDSYLTYGKPIEVASYGSTEAGYVTTPNPLALSLIERVLGEQEVPMAPFGRIHINFPAAYWRKANAIHKWFVDTTQGGVDDCQESEVELEQLEDLVARCRGVLHNPDTAAEILPSEGGFFFGSTEYDDWYRDQLKDTVEQLTPWLEYAKADLATNGWLDAGHFSYRASW